MLPDCIPWKEVASLSSPFSSKGHEQRKDSKRIACAPVSYAFCRVFFVFQLNGSERMDVAEIPSQMVSTTGHK